MVVLCICLIGGYCVVAELCGLIGDGDGVGWICNWVFGNVEIWCEYVVDEIGFWMFRCIVCGCDGYDWVEFVKNEYVGCECVYCCFVFDDD